MYREIVFRLTAENHPELASRLSGFVEQVKRAQSQIQTTQMQVSGSVGGTTGVASGTVSGMTSPTTQQQVNATKAAGAAVAVAQDDINSLRARVESDRQEKELAKLNKFLEEKAALEKRYKDLASELESRIVASGASMDDPKVKEYYWEVIGKARDAYYEKSSELAEKTAAEVERLDNRAAAAKLKVLEDQEKASKRAADAEKKRIDAEIKSNQTALETAEKKHQTIQAQIKASEKQSLATFASIGESAMRVARGMTAIGLAGEDDLKKVVQALLKVQGAFDIVSGGIQIWTKIQTIIESTRKTILLTAASEEALAKASAARAAIQAVGGSAGAGGDSRSVGRMVGDATSMSGGRLLGRAVRGGLGRAAGVAAGTAVAATVGVGAGLASDYFSGDGYSQGGFGELVGTGFLGARNLGHADKFLQGAAGRVGAGMQLAGGISPLFGVAASGIGIGGRMLGMGETSGSTFSNLVDSDKALADQEGRAKTLKAMHAAQNAAVASALPDIQQGFSARRMGASQSLNLDLGKIASDPMGNASSRRSETDVRLAAEILETEKKIAEVKDASASTYGRHEALIKALAQEQLELEKTKRDLVIQRASVSQAAAEAELQSSERQLRNVEATLDTQQRTLMTIKEQLMSAEERFGLLDEDKQADLIDKFKRAKAGENLSAEELRDVKGIGSMESDEIVRNQARARAKAAGVDDLFGKERDQIGKLEGDIKRNVDVAAEVRWEIEFDKKALEEQTAALEQAIRDGLKEQIDKNSEAVTKALAGEVAGINVRVDSLEQRVNNGAGARN